jgi:predicted GNAT family acetyltransferase
MTNDSPPVLVRNDEAHRYELHVGGQVVAFTDFRVRPNYVVMVHTETDPAFEGRGYGSALVKGLLADVQARGEKIKAECPFVAGYIQRHPEYADVLVTP